MKMILDVDTGIDDSLALAYACGLKDVDLIGVMTSFGNVTIDKAVKNTINVLDLFERSIPVYQGASHPIGHEFIPEEGIEKVHGLNGIGNVELGQPKRTKEEMDAVSFLIDSCNKYGDELTLVAVGPLTNLALAIQKDREAISKIGKIVIMGSALTIPGNVTSYAEANIINDPVAAKYVFESGMPCIVVGLDVTLKTFIKGKDIACWKRDTKAAKALMEMTSYYYHNEYDSETGGALHDPLAVDIAVYPQTCTNYFPINLTVITEGETRGMTIGNLARLKDETKSAMVCLDIDAKGFLKRFVSTIDELLEKVD